MTGTAVPPAGADQLRRRAVGMLFWFFALILVFNSLFGDMGLIQTLQKRHAVAVLRRDVARLRTENGRLLTEIQELRHDPYRIETIAREELGLIRPGEIIFLFQDDTSASAPGQEPAPAGTAAPSIPVP